MESGTSNGLYIILATVIMSIFLIISTGMGVSVSGMINDMVGVVEDGNDFSLNKIHISSTDIRIGPTGNEWLNLEQTERDEYFNTFLGKVTNEVEGVESSDWYNRLVTHSTSSKEYSGAIYGVYNDDGKLIKTYSYGLNSDSNYSSEGFKYIDVNDLRLVPDVVINEGTVNHYNAYSRYMHIDESGNEVWYRVYDK